EEDQRSAGALDRRSTALDGLAETVRFVDGRLSAVGRGDRRQQDRVPLSSGRQLEGKPLRLRELIGAQERDREVVVVRLEFERVVEPPILDYGFADLSGVAVATARRVVLEEDREIRKVVLVLRVELDRFAVC